MMLLLNAHFLNADFTDFVADTIMAKPMAIMKMLMNCDVEKKRILPLLSSRKNSIANRQIP